MVNGRVYRKNGVPKDNTQNGTPAGTSRNTSYNESGNNQTHKVTNETGCCWVFYLVVYVVVAAILSGLKNEFVGLCFQGRPIFSRFFQIFTKPTPGILHKKISFSPRFLCKTENREKIKKISKKGLTVAR